MDNEEIVRRYNAQFGQRRGSFDQVADLIERYIAPIRGGKFYQDQSTEYEIEFRRPEVFDSTAMNASSILTSTVQGAILPSDTKWFDLVFRDDTMQEDQDAMEWLQECGQRLHLALQDSKFELSIEEALQDMADFGNTVLFEEEEIENGVYKGLLFNAVPIRQIYFEEDWDGSILNFYRRLQWTPLQIMSKFPEDQIPDVIRAKAESPSDSMNRVDVIFAIYPRKDGLDEFPAAPKKRKYGMKYVLKEGAETIGEEGGYYEMPVFLARWARTSGSKWGHGPGNLAIPTVLTVNNMVRQELAYVEKVIDPPTLVSERNAYGDLDLTAGGVNVLVDIDGMRPYEANSRYGDAKMTQGEMRLMIERIYMADQIQMKDSPAMTATEAMMRNEKILQMLGPTRGRIEAELLNETLQRSFNIMLRNQQFPEVPPSVIEYQNVNGELDIRYLGPMARAQKADQVAAIEGYMFTVANLGEAYPEMKDRIDDDAAAKEMADLRNVPAKILRSDADVEKLRKDRQEAQAAAQEAAMAQEQGAGMTAMAEGEQAMQAVQ
jgi:hypothetical protein